MVARRAWSTTYGKRSRSTTPYAKPVWKRSRPAPSRSYAAGGPAGQKVKMRYSQQVRLQDVITGYSEQVFRAGSVYDPDFSGIGEQPLGHDQWSTIYKRYRVLGSSIKVYYHNINDTATSAHGVSLAVCLTDTSTNISDIATVHEQPVGNYRMIGQSDGGESTGMISLKSISQASLKGDRGVKFDNDYSAAFGASPTLDSYYHIAAKSEGATNVDVRIRVMIEYDVWIYDAVQLAES